ncbi:hypothetical protein A3Q56_06204 [Intoshia linei]|uniref:BZIP domain-containing protein n=1 Tax=Intoshia linei TaxID=1819745 RepID=A0A177AVR5_9BILA|nr:hypothetical protein A3Q56_06204 [Intoshia linei]
MSQNLNNENSLRRGKYKKVSNENKKRILVILNINHRTAYGWLVNGSLPEKKIGGYKMKSLSNSQIEEIVSWVEYDPQITLKKICEKFMTYNKLGFIAKHNLKLSLKRENPSDVVQAQENATDLQKLEENGATSQNINKTPMISELLRTPDLQAGMLSPEMERFLKQSYKEPTLNTILTPLMCQYEKENYILSAFNKYKIDSKSFQVAESVPKIEDNSILPEATVKLENINQPKKINVHQNNETINKLTPITDSIMEQVLHSEDFDLQKYFLNSILNNSFDINLSQDLLKCNSKDRGELDIIPNDCNLPNPKNSIIDKINPQSSPLDCSNIKTSELDKQKDAKNGNKKTETIQSKLDQKRARNRLAARRCRDRKIERISILEKKVNEKSRYGNELVLESIRLKRRLNDISVDNVRLMRENLTLKRQVLQLQRQFNG